MITSTQFAKVLNDDPHLFVPVQLAAKSGRPAHYGVISGTAVDVLMFPIATYLLKHIGLPWLNELRRYSELQRRKLHEWIDTRYQEEGFDPDVAEASSAALCDELERITDASARASWERLRDMVMGPSNTSDD